jgi:hypothetical protein
MPWLFPRQQVNMHGYEPRSYFEEQFVSLVSGVCKVKQPCSAAGLSKSSAGVWIACLLKEIVEGIVIFASYSWLDC